MEPIEEIRTLAPRLSPRAFHRRLNYWRKAGISEALAGERVGGTRDPKLPHFDRTDQAINEAERCYKIAIDGFVAGMSSGDHKDALRHLKDAETLEALWLKPIITPDKEMLRELDTLVSDARSCLSCGDTKEAWVKRAKKRGVKTPLWRTKKGLCQRCYKADERARLTRLGLIEPEEVAS